MDQVALWGVVANFSVAALTLVAVLVAMRQLRANRRVACESFARQCWLDYLKVGLQYPELGETRAALSALPGLTLEALTSGDTLHSQRYLWFLTMVMDTCENVIRYLPRKDWETTLIEQVRYHRPALRLLWEAEWQRYYSADLNRIVTAAFAVAARYDETALLDDASGAGVAPRRKPRSPAKAAAAA